ncbi:cell division protein CrgA [Millisia brevis]|uniref:cell division protein CrgA n=1 Tax=Millisia brevis TaxID=264148 RepID=UPI000831DA95|nr:cell division protein CrgA [Millisia brevis]
MPKSKVRKKPEVTGGSRSATRQQAYVEPSSPLYVTVMLGFMLLGLVWLLVYYLAQNHIAFIGALGAWNFLIGFGLMIVGLLMTMRWR